MKATKMRRWRVTGYGTIKLSYEVGATDKTDAESAAVADIDLANDIQWQELTAVEIKQKGQYECRFCPYSTDSWPEFQEHDCPESHRTGA